MSAECKGIPFLNSLCCGLVDNRISKKQMKKEYQELISEGWKLQGYMQSGTHKGNRAFELWMSYREHQITLHLKTEDICSFEKLMEYFNK